MRKIEKSQISITENRNAWKTGVLNFDTLEIKWDSLLTWTSNILRPKKNVKFNLCGISQKIGKIRMTTFRYENQLYFLAGNKLMEINEGTGSEIKTIGGKLLFALKQNGVIVFEQTQKQMKSIIPMENDPTPFIEAEDFDIRIFINNVLNEKNRRNRIFINKASK